MRKLSKKLNKKHTEEQLNTTEATDDSPPQKRRSLTDFTLVQQLLSGLGLDKTSKSTATVKGKKLKVSENDHSHGSFFLRAGAVGQLYKQLY